MELRHIKYFVTVAEELHFNKAAKRLNMSQPPLSQQIQSLEQELGIPLFKRGTREVTLTKEGEALLSEAYHLLETSERIKNIATQIKRGSIGKLSIGCAAYAFPELLPPLYKAFSQAFPDVELSIHELNTAETLLRLKNRSLDIGLVRRNEVEAPLAFYRLRKDKFVVILPDDHPFLRKKYLTLQMLSKEQFVIVKKEISPQFYESILPACQSAGFYPNITAEASSIQSQLGYVACGLGIGLLPQSLQDRYASNVVYRDLKENIPLTALCLVWNTQSMTKTVHNFIDISKTIF